MSASKSRMSGDLVGFIHVRCHVEKLLKDHAAGEDGRCKTCSAGGTSSAHVLAPCVLYAAALMAQGMDAEAR